MNILISFPVCVFIYLLWLFLRECGVVNGRGAQIIQGILLAFVFLTLFVVSFHNR